MRQQFSGAWLWFLLTGCVVCSSTVSAGQRVDIVIREYAYQPATISVQAGDEVRWLNREKRTSHSVRFTATAPDPALRSLESQRFFPDEEWRIRLSVPGEYDYECGPHPEMRGRITVLP